MPMHKWIARAAGGTSQRLKPGWATVAARSSQPPRTSPPGCVSVVMIFFLAHYRIFTFLLHVAALDSCFRRQQEGRKGAAGRLDGGEELPTHFWCPVTVDVMGDQGRRFVFGIGFEKIGDFARHADQLFAGIVVKGGSEIHDASSCMPAQ